MEREIFSARKSLNEMQKFATAQSDRKDEWRKNRSLPVAFIARHRIFHRHSH
jgi:hypothetical protein